MTLPISLSPQAMDQLMPMYLLVDAGGCIKAAGATIRKLRPDEVLIGADFMQVFEVRRPSSAGSFAALAAASGKRLSLSFRTGPRAQFKGIVTTLDEGGDVLINLSFGISVIEAVAEYGLTVSDFAVTDLAVEMLYLVEAKSAVMDELRCLNQRLQGAMIAAEERAYTDTLTGLKNRRAMEHVLGRLIDQGQAFGVMHLDLDYFKSVNDTLGHAAGDRVLQHVAGILVQETRRQDTVVRFGGDEFVLIFDGLVDQDILGRIALRLIERLEEPIPYNGDICRISASIGTAVSTHYARPEPDRMLHDADMALYRSKRAGRARVSFAAQLRDEDQNGRGPAVQ